MKEKMFILALIVCNIQLVAQININPDPNGDPWYANGCSALSNEESDRIPMD